MLNCWNEYSENRPMFSDLVRQFDQMITMTSDKVNTSFDKDEKSHNNVFKITHRHYEKAGPLIQTGIERIGTLHNALKGK